VHGAHLRDSGDELNRRPGRSPATARRPMSSGARGRGRLAGTGGRGAPRARPTAGSRRLSPSGGSPTEASRATPAGARGVWTPRRRRLGHHFANKVKVAEHGLGSAPGWCTPVYRDQRDGGGVGQARAAVGRRVGHCVAARVRVAALPCSVQHVIVRRSLEVTPATTTPDADVDRLPFGVITNASSAYAYRVGAIARLRRPPRRGGARSQCCSRPMTAAKSSLPRWRARSSSADFLHRLGR